ncbi:MAG: hypothetical protein KGL99_08445 [Burkholderiales bacterium]|nr:hypothetical protein [Burkholderiales bacterium]MDE2297301.1 hypothetical protein [Burkholderiales bacterium]MDE2627164.1 hypothetical protein [Burkholderiales bacterium]
MHQPRRHRPVATLAALATALLWGAVEVIALARSRWSLRLSRARGVPAHRRGA